jgi:LAS superfamily LD-carboxypeptidase LdcB
LNAEELTGRARTHVTAMEAPACVLHSLVVTPFLRLREAARQAGIDLQPVSGFRDFDRQLAIWNGKFSGERALNDALGRPLDAAPLSPEAKVAAILLWSALPGASRHHWGTDLDVIDAAALPVGYRVQLTAEEFTSQGVFAPLTAWLQDNAARFGFFQPFRGIRSGVQPEPWHLSFAPLAEPARRRLTPAILHDALERAPLLGKEVVLAQLQELHARYVAAIDGP